MGMHINRELLPLKSYYFLFNGGTGAVVPYMPTYAKQLGFSSVVVGSIYTILPIIGLIAKPLFGGLADKYRKHKLFFILFQVVVVIAFLLILFIPSKVTVGFHCNSGVSSVKHCSSVYNDQSVYNFSAEEYMLCNFNCIRDKCSNNCSLKDLTVGIKPYQSEILEDCLLAEVHMAYIGDNNEPLTCPTKDSSIEATCEISCNNTNFMEMIQNGQITSDNAIQSSLFWSFFFCMAASWLGMAVIVSIGDAICFAMLGDNHHLYGNQRLWGAGGWGIFSLVSGFMVDALSDNSINKDYTSVFILMVILLGINIIVSRKLKFTPTNYSSNILKDVGKLLASFRVLLFFIWCIVSGFCTALLWNFLFWHLETLANTSESWTDFSYMKTLQGLVSGVQCFGGEIPFFFFSGWILKKIGHVNAMSLVIVGFAIRFYLYSILVNPWYVLPIELFNGITFGISFSTMASYASIIAPIGTEATLQGLVGAIFEGVGVSFGSLIAGILIDRVGGSQTFFLFSIGAFIFAGCHCAVHLLLGKPKNEVDGTSLTTIDEMTKIETQPAVEYNTVNDEDIEDKR